MPGETSSHKSERREREKTGKYAVGSTRCLVIYRPNNGACDFLSALYPNNYISGKKRTLNNSEIIWISSDLVLQGKCIMIDLKNDLIEGERFSLILSNVPWFTILAKKK